MAEPTGIILEINLKEAEIKQLLNQKYDDLTFGKKLGYFFSKLLYDATLDSSNTFIFNYDKKTNTLFVAWMLNHFEKELLKPFIKVLKIISTVKSNNTEDFAIVTTTYPEILEGYKVSKNKIGKIAKTHIPNEVVNKLIDKFWSFANKNEFPDPSIALNKRNYYYKNFKNYYKKYLLHIEETEKPKKIANATKDEPFHLFDKFYSFGNKVFEFRNFTNQVIEIPTADPLTFRNVSGIYADKSNVYLSRLAANSPPNINPKTGRGNNPNAIWEYYIVEGVNGKHFNYVGIKYDTIYWKDNYSIYTYNRNNRVLQKIENVDISTFEYLKFTYGKDKNHLYCNEQILYINPTNYTIDNNGFIYDDCHVYHFENKLLLHAATFKVLKTERTKQFGFPNFYLADKNGTYIYNRKWDGVKLKKQ